MSWIAIGLGLVIAGVTPSHDGPGDMPQKLLDRIRFSGTVTAFRVGEYDERDAGRNNDPDHVLHCRVLGRAPLAPEWAQQAKRLFGASTTWAPDSVCGLCLTCPERPRYGLRFGSGKQRVDVLIFPGERVALTIGDVPLGGSFAASEAEVFALLQAAFPDDSALAGPPPIDRSAPDPPRIGDIVLPGGPPEPIDRVPPEYPASARELEVEGDVQVRALVGADGRVHDVQIANSARTFNQAALDAVRRWRFRPASCGGRAVSAWVVVPVRFRLH